MKKSVILLFALLLLVCLSLTLLASSFGIKNDYGRTYTSAVCDGNVCKDYEFNCLGGQVVSSRAISGFVTFGDNWVDEREEKDLC